MTAAVAPEPHPGLGPLSALVGTWRGGGEGAYPTIAPFRYVEELTFSHDGRPVLAYRQRTWDPGTGGALHLESGFLRAAGDGRAELVVAQPTGLVEASELEVRGGPDDLVHVDLWMSFAGHDDTHHLRSQLRPV